MADAQVELRNVRKLALILRLLGLGLITSVVSSSARVLAPLAMVPAGLAVTAAMLALQLDVAPRDHRLFRSFAGCSMVFLVLMAAGVVCRLWDPSMLEERVSLNATAAIGSLLLVAVSFARFGAAMVGTLCTWGLPELADRWRASLRFAQSAAIAIVSLVGIAIGVALHGSGGVRSLIGPAWLAAMGLSIAIVINISSTGSKTRQCMLAVEEQLVPSAPLT